MKHASKALALILFVEACAMAQDTLHVYFENGAAIEQLTNSGVTVMVSLVDTGHLNRVKVCVVNGSNQAINVLPEQINLHQTAPKEEDLRVKSQQELQRRIDRGMLWKEALIGLGTALSIKTGSVATDYVGAVATSYGSAFTYGSVVTSVNTADPELRARWFALGDQVAASGKNAKEVVDREYLKQNTVFPDTQITGTLWFQRDRPLESGRVLVTMAGRNYEFPFPAPDSAKAPDAPGMPSENQAISDQNLRRSGVLSLGLVVGNSDQKGVQIVGLVPDGAAEVAGLHIGDILVSVDGKPIRTVPEMEAALAKKELGSKVRVGYMFHSNLGWMLGTEKVLQLQQEKVQ